MAKRKKLKELADKREDGWFLQLPSVCINSPQFVQLKPRAVKLFLDFLAQYNGSNNGDLSACWKYMYARGWTSSDQLDKAKKELLAGGWIIEARKGGRHRATLYALTCFAIDECKGKLDVRGTIRPPGQWKQGADRETVKKWNYNCYPLLRTNINPSHGLKKGKIQK